MYILLAVLLLGIGAWLVRKGIRENRPSRIYLGAGWILASVLFFALLSFWAEMLWFYAVGYSDRFWILMWTRTGTFLFGTCLGAFGVYALTRAIPTTGLGRLRPVLTGGICGAIWGLASWNEVLVYLNRVATGLDEEALGFDTGFYLFQLPLYDSVFWLLLCISAVSMTAVLLASFSRDEEDMIKLRSSLDFERSCYHPVLLSSCVLALAAGLGFLLQVFHLLYSHLGVVSGPGWTDMHVRLPGFILLGLLTLTLGFGSMLPAVRRRWADWLTSKLVKAPIRLASRSKDRWRNRLRAFGVVKAPELSSTLAMWLGIGVVWVLVLLVMPALAQWFIVEPNEITLERKYIERNIAFTRKAFDLEKVEDRQFQASEVFTREMLDKSRNVLSEVRLWDWRALDAVYKQFQEIRLYYEFADVDMDRYWIGDRYRQVMVSAREMIQHNLPTASQTFVNQRLKYTHGYGLTLSTVSDFAQDGRPNLLVKDIPPRSEVPELEVDHPQIYYGELTFEPAVVNTREAEFDYPSGDENVYTRYNGKGGVVLQNLWRRLVYGWKFDGTRFLVSSYPTRESRIMFHRQVRERVQTLAPFLTWDPDPYIVLIDGRLHWIIDGYTTSTYYPYSEAFSSAEVIEYRAGRRSRGLYNRVAMHLNGSNYVRNSVKAVVDAFDGSVDLYVFDTEDPVLRVWRGTIPGLFKNKDDLPSGLRAHVRYPESFLLTQGLVYAKYHMVDPAVFYNQEDLWIRATEKYYTDVQPVEPYYVMWKLPGSDQPEFVSVLPFTPRRRQVLIGWIAGLCDGDNYGRLLAYKFPKERRVLGPQQVETKIDQHPVLAGQLTIWDQKGSSVIRGNVLAIPIEETLIYVEPIYLQADTAAYPELRLVVVMHGDKLSYGETFQEALENLFEEQPTRTQSLASTGILISQPDRKASKSLAVEANRAFERYLQLQGSQRFEEAAGELRRLQDLLGQMVKEESDEGD